MVKQTAKTITFEIFGGLLVLLLLGAGLFAYRLSTGPMELGIFRDTIAGSLTNARGGREVTLEKLQLEWSPVDRRVYVTATDLVFYDAANTPSAKAARADIVLDATSLLFGKVEPLRLSLHDGWLDVRRTNDGWLIGGEPLKSSQTPFGDSPEEWLASINLSLVQLLESLKETRDTLELESVSFEAFDLTVVLDDAPPLAISNARGSLTRKEGIRLNVSGQGNSAGMPDGLAISVAAPEDFTEIDVGIGFSNWPLAAMAARMGVAGDAVTGLPADFSAQFKATADAGLQSIQIESIAGEGSLHLAGNDIAVRQLSLTGDYLADEDRLVINATQLDAGPVKGAIVLTLTDLVLGAEQRGWTIESPDIALDFQPIFDRVWNVSGIEAAGTMSPDATRFDIEQASVKIGAGSLRLSGHATRETDIAENQLPFSVKIDGEILGPISKDDVLTFWPVTLSDGARNYLVDRILSATVTDATFRIDIKPDSLAKGYLENETIDVDLSLTDVSAQFLLDVPPLVEAAGTGHLSGNSFSVTLATGRLGNWQVDQGVVEFPQFNPKGEDFRVFAKAHGDAGEMLRIVSDSQLQLEARTGFNPDDISGESEMTVEFFRPPLKNTTIDQMHYTVTGTIQDASFLQAALGFDLTNTSARLDMDQSNITLSGFGQLGPAPVQFTWRNGLNDGDDLSSLSASAVINHEVLNQFGILGRAYMTGEVPVEVQAIMEGQIVTTADVSLELESARLDFPEFGWIKPMGVPAKATLSFVDEESGTFTSARIEAENAILDGDIRLDASRRVISADLRRAFLKGHTDVRGTIRRLADDSLAISLSGPMLDLSRALGDVSGLTSSGNDVGGAVTLDAEVDTLRLREGLDMSNARVALISANDRLESFIASGEISEGVAFETTYEAADEGGARISVTSGDAGFLARAFMGADFLTGGKLELTGTLASGDLPTKLQINVTDARMKNAPFLTQILSLASLRGLADTLGGNGVHFSRIEIPLTLAGGRYVVSGGRASGPALGLTANGWIGSEDGGIHVDGVLVPSFGINSALGGIPIIGDLFVGRDGEGIFSLTYQIRGTLEKAQVSVNPLSGVLPGVLRRIFESPAETEIPESSPGPIILPELQLEPLPEPEVIEGE